jgi:hypothetical protein
MSYWKKIMEFAVSLFSDVAKGELTGLVKCLLNDVESVDAKLDLLIDAPLKTGVTYLKSASVYPDASSQQFEKLREARKYLIEATSQSIGLKQSLAHYLAGRISEVLNDLPSRNFYYDQALQILYGHMEQFEEVTGKHYKISESSLRGTQFGGVIFLLNPAFGLGFATTHALRMGHSTLFGNGKLAEQMKLEQQKYLDQTMIETLALYEQGDLPNQLAPEQKGFLSILRRKS